MLKLMPFGVFYIGARYLSSNSIVDSRLRNRRKHWAPPVDIDRPQC